MTTQIALFLLLATSPVVAESTRLSVEFDHGHQAWSAVLRQHVSGGLVDYAALSGAREPLDAYLRQLEAVSADDLTRFSPEQRMAFWINSYNAYSVKLIVDHYPVASIRKVVGRFRSPFKLNFIPSPMLRGGKISLDTIEHRILRRQFSDARIHAAIVCAARSCPALQSQPFVAATLDRQLDTAMSEFLADPTRNRWNGDAGELELSSIFDWFREDFERDAGSLSRFVARHSEPSLKTAIKDEPRIRFLKYDWSLNERPRSR